LRSRSRDSLATSGSIDDHFGVGVDTTGGAASGRVAGNTPVGSDGPVRIFTPRSVPQSLEARLPHASRKRVPGPTTTAAVARDEAAACADLLIQVQKAIAAQGLKQAEAAKTLRVTQPRVSDLLRGRIDLFSSDTLIDMLARLGVGVRLVVKPSRSRSAA
jgi:predicted XRE-type DNA-binding protein